MTEARLYQTRGPKARSSSGLSLVVHDPVRSRNPAHHSPSVESAVVAGWAAGAVANLVDVKCPDGLEEMRIHLSFLVIGLEVVRAVGGEEADDVVEVSLVSCQHPSEMRN